MNPVQKAIIVSAITSLLAITAMYATRVYCDMKTDTVAMTNGYIQVPYEEHTPVATNTRLRWVKAATSLYEVESK